MKVTLRVAHSSKCVHAHRTALSSAARGSGCSCSPGYYTLHRDRGKVCKGPRVTDRSVAERLLTRTQYELDEGRAGLSRRERTTFAEWATEYLAQVEKRIGRGELKPRTLRTYRETVGLAVGVMGNIELAELNVPHIRRFYDSLPAMTPVSRDRHLRQLSACLTAAVDDERLERNPVPAFRKKLRLPKPRRGKAPFEDHELVRLWLAFDEPVALVASQFSCETGMRLGELLALEWPNVDLVNGTVHVEWTYDEKHGILVAPKDREARTIYLTPEARAVLEGWVAMIGVRDSGPVFSEDGQRLQPHTLQRALVRAMKSAGIPKIHPKLRLPRSFHSLRYTTSVLMQRRGYHPRLIEQTLGHGSLELSYGTYGGWTPEMLAAEAQGSGQ